MTKVTQMKGDKTMKPYNSKIVTLKLTRHEVCDLILACGCLTRESPAEKWPKLHDKLSEMLHEFDEKHFAE